MRRSLADNDLTVTSIFVNPAQFAPHEDLTTYPRTLPEDLKVLAAQAVPLPGQSSSEPPAIRKVSAIFLPTVSEMYPSGINQDVNVQQGTFIEVKGYSHQMEGQSRPTFFRGVATVVTKLFNVIEVMLRFPDESKPASDPRHAGRSQATPILGKRTYNKD